ncbi:PREDICTED: pentatricopeptide repeat-containing protein At2g22410, mitochondrial-like isoform X2 [Nelumbo nucifera]|nr:PREDICTED: pentatricopeptide repeat-containing protein At2g22410, mitochondrial-like isoform X2 [Nelumbo nucifera]
MCICNTMIKAFLLKGELIKIIKVYTRMLQEGLYPDNYTLPYMLKACKNLQNSVLGEQIHVHGLKLGFLFDIFVGNTMILMYSACGMMEAAARIFDEIPHRTAVSWTIMISGYARQGDIDTARLIFDEAPMKDRGIWGSIISGYVQNNCFKEGLQMFRMMQLTNLEPDEAVFVSVLCACAHLGALDIGIWIHRYLDRIGLPLTIRLGTALIDMYARCGNLDIAKKLFDGMQQRDTICWNAMISGVAVHGDGENALKLFLEMEKSGFRPNDITFIAVFTACSYSGMAYEGLHLFKKMSTVYGIEPKSEHYGCIIDFLGRAGLFEEAKEIIQGIPNSSSPYEKAIAWRALLSACCNQRKTQLAEFAAQQLVQLERHSGVYVLLSNMYAAAGNYNDARTVRMMMKKRGIEKTPGCSSIEINGFIHEFIAGEKAHLQMDEIHELLEKMNKHLEYNPN